MTRSIDLNADVGEGFGRWSLGDDAGLFSVITSANVACGFHAGDPSIIRRTCRDAAARGVTVGAQVSYPDLAGFGRRFMEIDSSELTDGVLYQISALEGLARVEGTSVRYVKPHGALYNAIVHHEQQAHAVADAVLQHGGSLALVGLPGGVISDIAREVGLRFVDEGFADRRYTPDGTLVPRSEASALLTDPSLVSQQVLDLASRGVASICVHSDTPNATQLAHLVRRTLESTGYVVSPAAP